MRHTIILLLLASTLAACAARLPSVAHLTQVRQGGAELAIETGTLGTVARDADLSLGVVYARPSLLVTIHVRRDRNVTVLWDESRFVWPDGRSEPVLGAALGLGGGQVGLRAPTKLLPGAPNALALTPQSRAGRSFLAGDGPHGPYRLELALRVEGQTRRYVATFNLSS